MPLMEDFNHKEGVKYMIQRIEELKAMNNELRKQADKLAEALDDGLYLYCEDKSTGGCMQCQTCTYIEETIKPALKEYRGEK